MYRTPLPMAPQERVRAPLDITVAIIGGGVGTSIALELCRRGCRVRLHDADPIACQHAVNALVAELQLHVAATSRSSVTTTRCSQLEH